jgi:hypothetical protein
MDDLAFAFAYAVILGLLVIVLTSAIVTAHTAVRLPRAFQYGSLERRVRKRALLVEVPIGLALIGGGELVMLVFLLHPASSVAVRAVSAVELLAIGAWCAYLWRLSRQS